MPEILLLDYRRSGVGNFQLGRPLEEATSRATLESARSLLVARGETIAVDLLDEHAFALHVGTNHLEDEFIVAHASGSAATIANLRAALGGARLPDAARALRKAISDAFKEEKEVRFLALSLAENIVRGEGGEYRFEEQHFDLGGFATIHVARDRSGRTFALKRLHARDEEAIARLRREIQEQRRIQHPNVMPIVDHDESYQWFIMPLAEENLAARWVGGPIDNSLLLEVLRAMIAGLEAAHALGLVHRDVTPRNVLRVGERWVVADWGVVRRPRGMTTMVRTQGELGTTGFAAPELFRTAHEATVAADVYAVGRIVAWAVTRLWPEQNVPLLPEGPWRTFVRQTTEHEASRRPQSMAEVVVLLASVEHELEHGGRVSVEEEVRTLLERIAEGEPEALEAIVAIALARPDDHALFVDEVAGMNADGITALVNKRPREAEQLLRAMHTACRDIHWGSRSFDHANVPLRWIHGIAQAAERKPDLGLLEDAVSALFDLEPSWDRWPQQARTREWLESIREGEGAATVARALRRYPEAAQLYLKAGSLTRAPASVRAALADGERAATAARARRTE